MLRKSITYTDFNGDRVTEDHYFHLSKADLIEMEMAYKGGLHEHLKTIVAAEDGAKIIYEFKQLILMAYGMRSDDGKRFIKTQELRDEFMSSEAYSALFMELCLDAGAAAEFVGGIVPPGLDEDIAKLVSKSESPKEEPKLLTEQDLATMEREELMNGLANGRYRLAP